MKYNFWITDVRCELSSCADRQQQFYETCKTSLGPQNTVKQMQVFNLCTGT